MNILQPALLVPLFSSLYSGASLTPLSPTVPEGNGNADGNGHIDVSGMSRGVRYSGQACRISAYYDLLVCDFDGARNRDGNPRVAVRTRWAETQGHPATAPGTGTARTEAMH
jgi:hypothetical protein